MTHPSSSTIRNQLLLSLNDEDLTRIYPHLSPVSLSFHEVLVEVGQPIEHLWFIEQGIASVVAQTLDHGCIEVACLGREAVAGLPILLGVEHAAHRTFMQVPGVALRIEADKIVQAMRESPSFRGIMLRFVHTAMMQMAHTALANGRHTINARLARWLLMCHDRLDTDDVPLTHEFLSIMLGVRRSGVTNAIHVLEGEHSIKASRGQIRVLSRDKLKSFAGGSYGTPEAEYKRVIGRNPGRA